MDIRTAAFHKSSSTIEQCPTDGRIEFAFIGRSNVGKSSLINMLLQKGALAKTSQIPGKTQLINHFLVNDSFYIVDLPGYGYAKVPKPVQKDLSRMIAEYTEHRAEMACLFILLDIRHAPLKIDLDFINRMGEKGIPFALVFTKADKISATAARASVQDYMTKLEETWEELPTYFITSSAKKSGKEELLDYMSQIIESADSNL